MATDIPDGRPSREEARTSPLPPGWPVDGLVPHPMAGIFRLLDGDELADLAGSIRENGLRTPIVMFEGMILDGRNRYLAAIAAGLFRADVDWLGSEHFEVFGGMGWDYSRGTQPLSFVWDTNRHRRHDDAGQRAMAAARYATMRQGARTDLAGREEGGATIPGSSPGTTDEGLSHSANLREVSQAEAAEAMGVSERLVNSATAVIAHGTPELVAAVDAGKIKVSAAEQVAKMDAAEQRMIASLDKAEAKAAAAKVAKDRRRPKADPIRAEVERADDVAAREADAFDLYGAAPRQARGEGQEDAASPPAPHLSRAEVRDVLARFVLAVIAMGVSRDFIAGRAILLAGEGAGLLVLDGDTHDFNPAVTWALEEVSADILAALEGSDPLADAAEEAEYQEFTGSGRQSERSSATTSQPKIVVRAGTESPWIERQRDTFSVTGGESAAPHSETTATGAASPDAVPAGDASQPDLSPAAGAAGDAEGSSTVGGDLPDPNGPQASPADTFAALLAALPSPRPDGGYSKAIAEPLIRAAYACDPIKPLTDLAVTLGRPKGTVLTWANRLGLTRPGQGGASSRFGARQ